MTAGAATLRDWQAHARAYGPIGPGDQGTLESTVPWMRRLIREGAQDQAVIDRAHQLVAASSELHPVEACFRFVQSLPYVRDESLAAQAGLDSDTSEILQGAPFQLELERLYGAQAVEGDCDCRCVLLQALLESLGYRTALVLIRGRGRRDFSHVYSQVSIPGRGTVPLDTIMDGHDGRPFFAPGQQVGPPDATGRKVIPVASPSPVLLIAACLLAWRVLS